MAPVRCKLVAHSIKLSLAHTHPLSYDTQEVIKHTRYSEKADVYSFGIVLCEVRWRQLACHAHSARLPLTIVRFAHSRESRYSRNKRRTPTNPSVK